MICPFRNTKYLDYKLLIFTLLYSTYYTYLLLPTLPTYFYLLYLVYLPTSTYSTYSTDFYRVLPTFRTFLGDFTSILLSKCSESLGFGSRRAAHAARVASVLSRNHEALFFSGYHGERRMSHRIRSVRVAFEFGSCPIGLPSRREVAFRSQRRCSRSQATCFG